ncbi:hypothetical protein HOC13_03365 [Candidatus Woesearchaeota archaeon]|jgi:hypothetical protein|nr:hypothetical protein [Candidatus Woesearchaeota archaeon]
MNKPKERPLEEAMQRLDEMVLGEKIEVVLLDQWRRERKDNEWRFTYLGDKIGSCDNVCESCPVYDVAGGEDDKEKQKDQQLITTLTLAEPEDLVNYDGDQRYLNCKSVQQYINSFINCFLGEMHARDGMLDELDYVVGFKVIYRKGGGDFETFEADIKKRVIEGSLKGYNEEHKELFKAAVKDMGLELDK